MFGCLVDELFYSFRYYQILAIFWSALTVVTVSIRALGYFKSATAFYIYTWVLVEELRRFAQDREAPVVHLYIPQVWSSDSPIQRVSLSL